MIKKTLTILLVLSIGFFAEIKNHTVSDSMVHNSKEVLCLAQNIYYEARSEGKVGMQAVAQVTMNRVNSKGFPSTICEVVFQDKQFSWTFQKKQKSSDDFEPAYNIAIEAVNNKYVHESLYKTNALFYHTHKVKPKWAKKMKPVEVIKNHKYYAKHTTKT